MPKLLLIAERERMDKDLTIAQMQGKFRLETFAGVGHIMQEDDPMNTAKRFYQIIEMFKIPVNKKDVDTFATVGIGNFHPNIRPYK